MELADLLKASDSRQWGRRCAKSAPSGLQKILEQYQSEWRLMVRVANNTSVRAIVRTPRETFPLSKFEGVVRRHDKILNELSNAINDGGLNSYKDPTPLWLHRNKKRSPTTPSETPAAKEASHQPKRVPCFTSGTATHWVAPGEHPGI